ncbi:MAG: signal peptidase II [candidate division WOR-3 bacterium]|nr:MAG: signal peptidase II [candidate division WOR-3 bacterium]
MLNAHPRRWFVWAAILSLAIDQIAKVLAYGMLEEHVPVRVLGDFVRLIRTANPRGLFGMHYGPKFIYFVLPLIGIALVIYFAIRTRDRWLLTAYGIVMGGAIGNLIDRARLGSVIDFIDMGIGRVRWYTFNPADAFVVIGIVMLVGKELLWRKKKEPVQAPAVAAESDEGAGSDAPSTPES